MQQRKQFDFSDENDDDDLFFNRSIYEVIKQTKCIIFIILSIWIINIWDISDRFKNSWNDEFFIFNLNR